MPSGFRQLSPRSEAGSMLIEVLVSALLLMILAVGVFKAFDAATRASAQERHRARAHSIAQADLSRMRTMRISDLWGLNQTWTVREDDQLYTVNSRADIQTDATGTASCEEGVASADYFKITSTVSWSSIGSRPPVRVATLVAPPNGSVNPSTGALAVGVEDSQNVGIPGVGVSGSGPASFSGVTEADGCQIFGNLPAGNYTLTLSGIASGLVDVDGKPPEPKDTSVVAESTNTVVFQYDSPGAIPVNFTTKNYSNVLVASMADSIIAFNSGMTAARAYGTPGSQQSQLTATSLFPFPSPYAVYAGTCEGDNPNPLELEPPPAPGAIASVTVPPGTTVSPVPTIQLPALHLTVRNSVGLPILGAAVKIKDTLCSNLTRNFTTNALGQLANPGLPYSEYQICSSANISGTTRRETVTNSLNEPSDLTGGTVRTITLTSSDPSGSCP